MNKLISLLRDGLARLGSFGRKRADEAEADEAAPSKLADTVVDVQTAADAPAENEDGRPSGLWSRLMARFSQRKNPADDESEAEPPLPDAKGDRAERRAGGDKGAERGGEREGARAETMEAQEQGKGFWSRLVARFSLRKKATGDDSEAEAPLPGAKGDRAEDRAGGGKGAGGRGGSRAEAPEVEAPAEQPERGRIRGMLARKPVWISLVVLAVAGVSAAGWFAVEEFRARSDANARMLQQRNQALAEQNRKLRAENAKLAQAKNKPRVPVPGRAAGTDPMGEPDAAQAGSAGSAAEDCTVKDKVSVRDTLKGCIEGFNAGSGR